MPRRVTEIVVQFGFANPVEGFLSFAPGGQAEMTVLGIIAGADLGFVVVHHLTRIVLVITGAPIVAKEAVVDDQGRDRHEHHEDHPDDDDREAALAAPKP